jgi:Caspase domain
MTDNGDTDFALVIGIKHYPHLRQLDAPVRDATAIDEWLRARAGLPKSNIELVVSGAKTEERPIQKEIDDGLYRILDTAKNRMLGQPGWRPRRLYVYFAGHGCSRQLEHIALLMADASLDRINRAMDATEYRAALARRLFPEQVYWFDCCRNYDALVRGRGPDLTVADSDPPVEGLTQVVWYAAGFTEFANERVIKWHEERSGLFTAALLEGLHGAAATGDPHASHGIVFTDRLQSYVRDRLRDLAEAEKVQQAMWMPPPLGDPRVLVLARNVPIIKGCVRVEFPTGTTRVVVRDASLRTVGSPREIALDATAETFDLEFGSYTFTVEPSGASCAVRLLPGKPDSVDLRSAPCRS